ncbi:alanine:cation symporter family protein, partial [Corynebacterium epidermidicanis]|uniref:Sodium:alanine symporter family n=1 Tax=Corynebacterium epidermidicanis TaxID=1050174 RepID=A0A0G3GRA2_9CORY
MIDISGGESSPLNGRGWLIGVGLALVAGVVILGGIQKIASMTSRLVPVMAVLYFLATSAIVLVNYQQIPKAIELIVVGGLTGEGVKGGLIGVAIIGIQRALFSNVAGVGSAGLAHSVAKNNRPAEEGFVAAWEPFIDSVIVCTLTAFAIIVTGQYQNEGADGIILTTNAFSTVHAAFPVILSVCIVLFGFSTVLSYSFYGRQAAGFLFKGNRFACRMYDVVYLLMIVVGAAVSLETVTRFSDSVFFIVVVPNLLGIYLLSGKLKEEVQGYRRLVDSGECEVVPEHERSTLLGKKKVEVSPRSTIR